VPNEKTGCSHQFILHCTDGSFACINCKQKVEYRTVMVLAPEYINAMGHVPEIPVKKWVTKV